MLSFTFGLSLLLVIANQTSLPLQNVPLITLDELRRDHRLFANRQVRLHGQIDQCYASGCSLCPLDATPAKPERDRCLAIDFDRMRGGQDNRGADMDSAFRYADVIVTARFDPTCLEGVCLDRAPVLIDARVEQVTRRRRSSDGLIWEPEKLSVAPTSVARLVGQLVRDKGVQPVNRPTAVFAPSSDPAALKSAIVCKWWGDSAVRWPISSQGAVSARSTEDRYRCWYAERNLGVWSLRAN